MNCTSLAEFRYPKSWSEVDGYASGLTHGETFAGCESLTYVEVPEGVTTIPAYAFYGAEYLQEVSLPATLEDIDNCAFADCVSLTALSYPEGLIRIGRNAFEGCTGLLEAKLPDSVTTIGERAFMNCTSLAEFRYPKSLSLIHIYKLLETVTAAVDRGELSADRVPLIFVRVRNLAQFKHFAQGLTKAQVRSLCGVNFPKFNAENGYEYYAYLRDLNERFGEILYGMPIIEDPEVAYKESRMPQPVSYTHLDVYKRQI